MPVKSFSLALAVAVAQPANTAPPETARAEQATCVCQEKRYTPARCVEMCECPRPDACVQLVQRQVIAPNPPPPAAPKRYQLVALDGTRWVDTDPDRLVAFIAERNWKTRNSSETFVRSQMLPIVPPPPVQFAENVVYPQTYTVPVGFGALPAYSGGVVGFGSNCANGRCGR